MTEEKMKEKILKHEWELIAKSDRHDYKIDVTIDKLPVTENDSCIATIIKDRFSNKTKWETHL